MLLPLAIASIVLALIFYSISVYWEIVKKKFTRKTVGLFWIGFAFDLLGTILMCMISEGFAMDAHAITGVIALTLMGTKAVWSLVRYQKKLSSGVPKIYTLVSFTLWIGVFLMGFAR